MAGSPPLANRRTAVLYPRFNLPPRSNQMKMGFSYSTLMSRCSRCLSSTHSRRTVAIVFIACAAHVGATSQSIVAAQLLFRLKAQGIFPSKLIHQRGLMGLQTFGFAPATLWLRTKTSLTPHHSWTGDLSTKLSSVPL
jgi:hypothetical protein